MKNLIGLDIKVKNGYSNYLNKILNGINLFNYVWEIKRQRTNLNSSHKKLLIYNYTS